MLKLNATGGGTRSFGLGETDPRVTCEHLGLHVGDCRCTASLGAWDLSSSGYTLMVSSMIVEVGGMVRRTDD